MNNIELEMKGKILAYDKAIDLLKEFVEESTKGINQVIQDSEGTANFDLEISGFQILEECVKDLQRLRNNYNTALCMFKVQNMQLEPKGED